MADQAHARNDAAMDEDNAEWRPYQVWASQMRSDDRGTPASPARTNTDSSKQGWDPYQVWKRHVQQANNPDSKN